MKKKTKSSGNIPGQLSLEGMGLPLSSAGSADLRNGLGKNTYDPTWKDKPRPIFDQVNPPNP